MNDKVISFYKKCKHSWVFSMQDYERPVSCKKCGYIPSGVESLQITANDLISSIPRKNSERDHLDDFFFRCVARDIVGCLGEIQYKVRAKGE